MKKTNKFKIIILITLALMLSVPAMAADWPTRLHDGRRSGVTTEQLVASPGPLWTYTDAQGVKPAWTQAPAQQDFWHNIVDLHPRQDFDHCMDVAAVGNYVYFGSSGSDSVTCLNTTTSAVAWRFYTGGPVRFAPWVDSGKVYFGSDDGYIYCVDASTGAEDWSYKPGVSDAKVWGNQNMVSTWPVRTGVAVADGYVYYAAGLWLEEGIYVGRLDDSDGSSDWKITASHPHQGYLLRAGSYLYCPSGKTYPTSYAAKDGKLKGDYNAYTVNDGGSWGMITANNNDYWWGPMYGTSPGSFMARYNATRPTNTWDVSDYAITYMVEDGTYIYYVTDDNRVVKANSGNFSQVWSKSYTYPYALIKAGNYIYAGGDGTLAAFDISDGSRDWTASVTGKVYGLAAANGILFASTDAGNIYAFGDAPEDTDPPTPDPATFSSAPSADSESAISMTATTGTDVTGPVYYYFDETSEENGGTDSGWQTSPNYTDDGLDASTQYTYTVQMRDSVGTPNVGTASSPANATTNAPDATAPTPNPATWASAPSADSESAISMTATTGADATGPVEYFFDETTGGTGATDSEWQTSPDYTDSDLAASTQYTYTVQMRDSASTPNVGTVSSGASATTDTPDTTAPTPNPATFASAPSADSDSAISMTATTGSDATDPVEYYFDETTDGSGATDSGWQTSPNYTDDGLDADTQYTYTVQMRDSETPTPNVGTASSPANATTDEYGGPTAGLLGYWSMNDGGGTTVTDNSTNSNTGTCVDSSSWVSGKFGGALDFTGGYVGCGTDSSLRPSSALSIAAWVKVDTFAYYTGIAAMIHDSGAVESGYMLMINNYSFDGFGGAVCGSDGGLGYINDGTYSTGTWYHVAITFNGSTETLYVNASSVASGSESSPINYTPGSAFEIGRYADDDEDRRFDGIIDDVGVWNRVLTSTELDYLYNSGTGNPILPSGPDTDPPTPNPATFSSAPAADSTSAISMTATTGADATGPVEYYFNETTSGPGATDSEWQTSPSYTDAGLTASTQYTYTVQMRDSQSTTNVGTASSPANATTDAGCTPTDMHIEAAVCAESSGCSQGKKHGQATVTIYDDCGVPVADALVDGTFGGDYSETIYDIATNASGQAVLETSACVRNPSFTFTVDDVTHGTLPYDSNDDLATGCSG